MTGKFQIFSLFLHMCNHLGLSLKQLSGYQCVLGDEQCSYNINLISDCRVDRSDLSRTELPTSEQTERFIEMERNLVMLRVDHARRIADLENQINKLLKVGVSSITPTQLEAKLKSAVGLHSETMALKHDTNSRESDKSFSFKDDEDHGENLLLIQMQKEFSALRRDLAGSRRQTKNLEAQLESTRSKINQTSAALIRTTSKLMETETNLDLALLEKETLTTQLNEIKRNLNTTKTRLDSKSKELKNMTSELLKTRKRNNQLHLNVQICLTERESLRFRLNESLEAYNELSIDYKNLTHGYNLKASQLIECFRGKTSQFCGFEDPKVCGFTQDNVTDDLDWVRWKDRTPSLLTGPSVDHTCGNNRGYYMYFDASPPGKGTKARMFSARYYGLAEQCVQFYYHMHGRYIGTLNVYTVVPGNDVSPLWRAFGNQGDVWIMARLSIPAVISVLGYQVVFEGIVDRGYQGDIAIDDFLVFDGYC